MSTYVGIFREEADLKTAISKISELKEKLSIGWRQSR